MCKIIIFLDYIVFVIVRSRNCDKNLVNCTALPCHIRNIDNTYSIMPLVSLLTLELVLLIRLLKLWIQNLSHLIQVL